MTFMKFEDLRAKHRVNYDKLVIKHHLDKTIKSIEEYNDNVWFKEAKKKFKKYTNEFSV